jgi:hypothetical protein
MPLPLLAISAGASALSTLPNWYQSWKQGQRADELAAGLKRPDFEIPKSELESLASAKAQAGMTRLPGQSAIEGRLDQTTANLVSDVQRMGTGGPNDINAAARAYGMQQEKENQLGIEASNMYLRNQDILRSELDENADWQQKAWEWDKKMPYENTANAIGALRESSARNFDNAWKDLTGGVSNLAMGEYLRGAGGLDLGGGKMGTAGGGATNPNAIMGMLTDQNQNGATQNLIGAGSLTDDQAFKINKRPVFDAFNLGGYSPQFTRRD